MLMNTSRLVKPITLLLGAGLALAAAAIGAGWHEVGASTRGSHPHDGEGCVQARQCRNSYRLDPYFLRHTPENKKTSIEVLRG